MRYLKLLGVATIALLSTHIALPKLATATVITINFDAVTSWAAVDEFYNGGDDSEDATGPSLGVSFNGISTLPDSNAPSQPNAAYNGTNGNFANVYAGFTALSFEYIAITPSTITVYDDLNGSGNVLGSTALTVNSTFDAFNFSPSTVTFSGVGRSFVLTSTLGEANAGFDNLVINTVPEPGTLALLGIGTLAASAVRRKELTSEA